MLNKCAWPLSTGSFWSKSDPRLREDSECEDTMDRGQGGSRVLELGFEARNSSLEINSNEISRRTPNIWKLKNIFLNMGQIGNHKGN